jgi:hypothetical protein
MGVAPVERTMNDNISGSAGEGPQKTANAEPGNAFRGAKSPPNGLTGRDLPLRLRTETAPMLSAASQLLLGGGCPAMVGRPVLGSRMSGSGTEGEEAGARSHASMSGGCMSSVPGSWGVW